MAACMRVAPQNRANRVRSGVEFLQARCYGHGAADDSGPITARHTLPAGSAQIPGAAPDTLDRNARKPAGPEPGSVANSTPAFQRAMASTQRKTCTTWTKAPGPPASWQVGYSPPSVPTCAARSRRWIGTAAGSKARSPRWTMAIPHPASPQAKPQSGASRTPFIPRAIETRPGQGRGFPPGGDAMPSAILRRSNMSCPQINHRGPA